MDKNTSPLSCVMPSEILLRSSPLAFVCCIPLIFAKTSFAFKISLGSYSYEIATGTTDREFRDSAIVLDFLDFKWIIFRTDGSVTSSPSFDLPCFWAIQIDSFLFKILSCINADEIFKLS